MNSTITDPNDPRYHYPQRSDLFSSDLDLKRKEDVYSKYAHSLHEKLLEDVHRNEERYDCFMRPEREKIIDPLFSTSKEFVESDRTLRKKIGGPTISRTKFHPSYWKVWNKERDLLEQMSRDEILKEMYKSQNVPPSSSTNKHSTNTSNKRSSKSAALQPMPINPIPSSSAKVCRFNGIKTLDDHYENFDTFDSHLMNDTSVKSLFEMSGRHKTVSTTADAQHKKSSSLSHLDLSYIPDPNAMGKSFIKGGALSKAPKFLKVENTTTNQCDIPPLPSTVQCANSHDIKGGAFSIAKRFGKDTIITAAPGGNTYIPCPKSSTNASFAQAPRFKTTSQLSAELSQAPPGPGAYDVPRLLDPPRNPDPVMNKVKDLATICEKYLHGDQRKADGFLALSPAQFNAFSLYCHGCNQEDHIKYGMCKDNPNCGSRSHIEQALIRRNDLRRLAGYEYVDKVGKNKDNITDDILVGKEIANLIADPLYKMTALYTAAFKNDTTTIEKLSTHGGGVNPNVQQEESGYTALHIAVARKNAKAVYSLVNCFRGTIDLHRQDYVRGETPLHIASRQGYIEITSILCQEESCDPRSVPNFAGQYPLDMVGNHQCFQYIKTAIERNEVLDQIRQLKGCS